ncbi:PREDICTED: A-kinase anchor protein 12-like isoform X2 [Dinoponera quadriceps]|uniref:A-kinase anchor protein 12-like isoform X2 n=1 Tax=Dinoponera quadriceps TaxID=609295 RepID=A0A6P3Y8K0_DINQU|nr:PREDICTED: A-kinase anchor protein 12-like isoform X2 [Dinoponera quadriceps]
MLSPSPPINRPSLHPGTGYLIGPRVPQGLAAVVEGLTREVLRHRPEDIYVFAAHHFERLLKLREQYHADKYRNIREFDDDFGREFNLWPSKEAPGDTGVSTTGGWSLDKEVRVLERGGKAPTDVEESPEEASTDKEKRKVSKQTCTKTATSTKRASRRSTKDVADPRATKIIPQMSALRSSGRTILTKDIKQELRKNKLNSGEKGKLSDNAEKGVRGERRSRSKVSKADRSTEEEADAAKTTAGKTSTRRPLKKVRRIETESETETERETPAKDRLENGYERTRVKGSGKQREATLVHGGRPEAEWLSEHSSGRKVSSRALSMDRIRAYVLRKFASTASLEVLRSPTYVEQVQEVIDRAAPIIREKLEEMRRPRGSKRSRSVDFAWNEESFRRYVAKDMGGSSAPPRDDEEKAGRREKETAEEGNVPERRESTDGSHAENEETRPRGRRSAGRRSRRRGSGDRRVVDDDSEHEPAAGRDTLEARLTATQSILEGISMSASELNGARKADAAGEVSPETSPDHAKVSLPIVRPPSSRSSRNAAKNGSDSLTLPPISPDAPKSTKKKDELSLPVLSATGNHSAVRSQEQDDSKDAEEASTMRDITSDIEDVAALPDDEDAGLRQDSLPDARPADGEDSPRELAEKRASDVSLDRDLDEYRRSTELEAARTEEVYKDSLNVTPEVADVPLRPDSLEPDEDEREKPWDDSAVRNNAFDDLKDRLIEIEMAERNIEKALAGQQIATCLNEEAKSEAGEPTTVEETRNEEARKSISEAGEIVGEIEKSTSERGSPNEEKGSMSEEEREEEDGKPTEVGKGSVSTEKSSCERGSSSEGRESTSAEEKDEEGEGKLTNEGEKGSSDMDGMGDSAEIPGNDAEISTSEVKGSRSGVEMSSGATNQTEPSEVEIADGAVIKENGSKDPAEVSANEAEELPSVVEDVMVKRHVKNLGSMNAQSRHKDGQIEVAARETDDKDDNANGKAATESVSQSAGSSGTTRTEAEPSGASLSTNGKDRIGKTRVRRRRGINKSPGTTPSPLEIPFAYVLSEGSPYEIPDFVTTVIIPDRPCPSPVIPEIEDDQPRSTSNLPIESTAHEIVVDDVSSKDKEDEDRAEYGMEAFGEYIRPEVTASPIIDFAHSSRSVKPGQDLDRIKEEGEEEEEDKEDDERGKEERHSEEKDDGQVVEQAEGIVKPEDIVEHEETETDKRTISEATNVEEISSSRVPECEVLPGNTGRTDLTSEGKKDVAVESRSTLDNSSEENESSRDIHTTTSSDVKESSPSNRSIESSSVGRPIVPELNLDSLQDNTVSSFKMTANGTATKESNDSRRESDATMSLIEPLTPDERLTIGSRQVLADREEETPAEEELAQCLSNFQLQSEVPEADQLYRAEHAEYELLEKDLLSAEAVLEDEAKSLVEDAIDSKADAVEPTSRGKEKSVELDSEEEIARELIGLLDKEAQLCSEESGSEKRLEDHAESNLDADDKSGRPLSDRAHSVSVDEAEKEESGVPPERLGTLDDEGGGEVEATSELSSHVADSNQENEAKDDVITSKETEETRLEVEGEEHVEPSQVSPPTESERDESLDKDNATMSQESEESKSEIEEKKHVETRQVSHSAESERDESLDKDNATMSQETEESKSEVEEKKHVETGQVSPPAESERDECVDKDNAIISQETESEESKSEVEEKKHVETGQVSPPAESERDECLDKDNATMSQETEESKSEIEEKKHVETGQVSPPAESEREEFPDKATMSQETEGPKSEVEEKEHIETSQVSPPAESEREESPDKATMSQETEGPKSEVDEKEHIETSEVSPPVESEREESPDKDNATMSEKTGGPKSEVEEKEYIETSQVSPPAESEREESPDKATMSQETEAPKSEVDEKEHIETSEVSSSAESKRDESPDKDNATMNRETEDPKLEVEEEEHINSSRLAPLAEFEQDDLEENGKHEIPNGKITAESKLDANDVHLADNQESPGGKQMNIEDASRSQSEESVIKVEESHEKQEENKREKREGREGRERENAEVREEESNDEGKGEREEATAHEENQREHLEVRDTQEEIKSREGSLEKSSEKDEDAGHDGTIPTESITSDGIVADDQTARVAANGKEEDNNDLSTELERVHGPITSAISEQSSKDYAHGRYWTMGTKSSTAETVIAAFGSNASTDEKMKSLDDAVTQRKDDFYSAAVKIQACIRGFLARHRLRKDLRSSSASDNVPMVQKAAVIEQLTAPEDRSNLREGRSGRHRLRREEALRKTTLSLENAFATSRLQHTGEFHDSVPLPLFDVTSGETDSTDSLDESLDEEVEEEQMRTDIAKPSTCETTDCNCHGDERRGSSQKSNVFAGHSNLPIVMHLLADASRNRHFGINPDAGLNAEEGAKLVEPALDILMLGYPRDDATLQNRYLNFITSVEDIGSNVDFLPPDAAAKSANRADDAQYSITSDGASLPESLREPLALPGIPQGVVIEELTSLDEVAGDDSPSNATKTSLDTNIK